MHILRLFHKISCGYFSFVYGSQNFIYTGQLILLGCVVKEVTIVWTRDRGLDERAESCIETYSEKRP